MAVIEKDGLYQYIDENGNIYILYPVTKFENVTGTGKLIHSTDGKTLKTLDGTNIDCKPQKGVDYFTEAEKNEMVSAVISALPKYNGEVVEV